MEKLDVLFINKEIVVVNKPAGIASQGGVNIVTALPDIAKKELGFNVWPVHRLDKETAGCVLFARTKAAASQWALRFDDMGIRKTYRAMVRGSIPVKSGYFDNDIIVKGKPKPSISAFHVLSALKPRADSGITDDITYLELRPLSGRMHQLRIHCTESNLPIVGDDKYGDFALNRLLYKTCHLRHLLLWAYCIELEGIGPIRSPMPPHMAEFLGHFQNSAAIAKK